jgi:hypothetical protein
MEKITCEDIKALEGLAPGVSSTDKAQVEDARLRGEIFRKFSASERDSLLEKVSGYNRRIPSLTLFFQDALFLGIAATRIKKLLDPVKYGRDSKRKRKAERDLSIRDKLEMIFNGQARGEALIQMGDHAERLLPADQQQQFELAYRQVWLCAWRISCGTPGEGNRPAELWARTDPHAEYELALCARHLGFTSDRIEKIIRNYSGGAPNPWFDFVVNRVPKLKRCGIPYVITFKQDRKTLYLD